MSSQNFLKINTMLKAYKLIHDPVMLLNLLYSKYGDIEEDFQMLYINQLVYDKSSRYNIFFKEYQFLSSNEEYLKRFYQRYETKPRIPKLSEYYKNYHLFFCRPNFRDYIISDLMENYGDDKAEVFYKNNFDNSSSNNEEKEKSDKHDSESLSSLDNITDNKIIFTKKAKKMIDQNLDTNFGTLTLTSNSINLNSNNDKNYNDGLISKRSANDSFEKIVHNLIYYKKNKIKLEKNKKCEMNRQMHVKKGVQSGKKQSSKVGGNYASKKINKNIIYNLNINNNGANEKIAQNMRNKNSLFSLLKSNNIITKTDNTNQNGNGKKSIMTLTITSNKTKNNNFTNIFCSPKNNKDHNFNLISKLEEFNNNLLRPNTSFHHKRNKTVYFNQNQMANINLNPTNTLNNNNNHMNTLSNILTKNNNSRNNIDNFKNLNYRQTTQFNNFLTINNSNNILKYQKGNNDMKNKLKNKKFEFENINNNNLINKISTLKDNLKIQNHKNRINHNSNNNDLNDQIMKKHNGMTSTGSKFNLVKNTINMNNNNNNNKNNKIKINKNTKNSHKYFNPKFSPINCFSKNLINNNKTIGFHKKSQTTILSNIVETSSKNQICSPISMVKQQRKLYNINKSENQSSKIKQRIAKNRINNLNINFNNVIFNAPLSDINENLNFNSNYMNNGNNTSYKLLTPTNNRINFNNTFNNNITHNISNKSHQLNNNLYIREAQNEKINYITNLKNFCNFSRNKTNLYGRSFSQTEDNQSLIKQNNNAKTFYDKNKIINQTYLHMNGSDKQDMFKKKKSEIIIPKPNKKTNSLKNNNKKSNQSKKSKKKVDSRNKKFENGMKNFGKTEISRGEEITRVIDDESFRVKEDNKNTNNLNISNNLYSSPNTTGRIFTIQPINVNRNNNLASRKIIKNKQRIKIK